MAEELQYQHTSRITQVLKGIVCSFLDLSPDTIQTIQISNPISLKEDVSAKEMILDVKANLQPGQGYLSVKGAVVTLKNLSDDELFKLRYQVREDQLRQQWDMKYYSNTEFGEMEEQNAAITAEKNVGLRTISKSSKILLKLLPYE